MSPVIRPASIRDLPDMVQLLLADAWERHDHDPLLWALAEDAEDQIEEAVTSALTVDVQPIRQFWHVAETDGAITGVVHAKLLPVPPIYAGEFGDPGLILPDSFTSKAAPAGTTEALIAAAEAVLEENGARITLSSFVAGPDWKAAFERRGYEPLTLYLSRAGFCDAGRPSIARPATAADVPGTKARSAENRQVLFEIDPFWAIRPEADARFGAWMRRSLTLPDRDMLVIGPSETLEGYVVAQPASQLHFPPAHNIRGVGVIDDFYHPDLAYPAKLANEGRNAADLLRGAEAALAQRCKDVAFVVCPAGWLSKAEMLEKLGYGTLTADAFRATFALPNRRGRDLLSATEGRRFRRPLGGRSQPWNRLRRQARCAKAVTVHLSCCANLLHRLERFYRRRASFTECRPGSALTCRRNWPWP